MAGPVEGEGARGGSPDPGRGAPDPDVVAHLDALPVAVDLLDADGALLHANPAARALRTALYGSGAGEGDAGGGLGGCVGGEGGGVAMPWGDTDLIDEVGSPLTPDQLPARRCLTAGGTHEVTIGVWAAADATTTGEAGGGTGDGTGGKAGRGTGGEASVEGGGGTGDGTGGDAGTVTDTDTVTADRRWFRVVAAPAPAASTAGHAGALVTYLEVSHERRLEERLRLAELHDPLTGLPNRRLLSARYHQAQASAARAGQHIGLVYLDLDRFKAVNDAHGHGAGDRFLREFGTRLQAITRGADTAARVGGDEFVVLCTHLDGALGLQRAASRIADAVDGTVVLEGRRATLGASVGWVLVGRDMDLDTALNQADTAMYRDKARRSAT